MKIICAGMSKTGTKSLNAALTQLGHKVYDFPDPIYLHGDTWMKMFNGEATREDLQRILSDYDAGMDAPVNEFWEDILEAFPNAKVILTVRDDEQIWLQSFVKQAVGLCKNLFFMFPQFVTPTGRRMRIFLDNVGRFTFSAHPLSMCTYFNPTVNSHRNLKAYRRHNANVIQRCPKDRLLIYNCKEGWSPLCAFLGVPVPDVDFPHKNVRGSNMDDAMRRHPLFIQIGKELLFFIFVFGILLSFCIFKLFRCVF